MATELEKARDKAIKELLPGASAIQRATIRLGFDAAFNLQKKKLDDLYTFIQETLSEMEENAESLIPERRGYMEALEDIRDRLEKD